MTETVKIALAQINPVVGDIMGNVAKIKRTLDEARLNHIDLVVFPEMTITGYPPEDLLLREGLYPQVEAALNEIVSHCSDIACVLGYPMQDALGERFNMAAWIENNHFRASYIKQNLPNYSVFDERRYFTEGDQSCIVEFKNIKFGLLICEDIWKLSPSVEAAQAGADVLLTLNASPFSQEKHQDRVATLQRRVDESKCAIVYVNQVGGQDELVFDGGSFAMNTDGEVCMQAPEFIESLQTVTFIKQGKSIVLLESENSTLLENEARLYEAIKLGIKDYVTKNGFSKVLLGLSGGIDSALTLSLAVDALGCENVSAVMMPYQYTADISKEDAAKQAVTMGVHYQEIPIASVFESIADALAPLIDVNEADLTQENLQARIRGTLLMTLSNKTGALVLATSNKSEVAVGYSTLYGDMVGGFSPLKDLPKTLVYKLAVYRNQISQVIPERVITRPPSAELRPDQTDQDSLPDYDLLDAMIELYVNHDKTAREIAKQLGCEIESVTRVINMIKRNEYKRRQAAPGIKITQRAFGRDRRYPITHRYFED